MIFISRISNGNFHSLIESLGFFFFASFSAPIAIFPFRIPTPADTIRILSDMGAPILDKTSPFTTPTKLSPKLTSSAETKENRLAIPSFTNQMRSSTKKNFMSPTISASSKTVARRKKILAERNGGEATEPTCAKFHRRRSSSFDLKHGSLDMGASTDSLTSSINEISSVEDGLHDAKLKPYDPILNYCSPRPKFLLYKPDRRSEILRRYDMIDSTSSESESSVEHEECLVKQNGKVAEEARDTVNHKDIVTAHLEEAIEGSVKEIKEKIEERVEDCGKKSEVHNEVHENIEHHEDVHESTEHRKEDHEIEIIENHRKEDLVKDAEILKDSNMINQLEKGTRSTTLENETIEALQTKDENDISIQHMEIEDEDEEGEFEEEGDVDKCWSFKSLLKFWLVILILGLSTLYLFSMNSTSVCLNGDDRKVHCDIHRAPFIHGNGSGYVIQDELAKMGFEGASHRIKGEIIIREPGHYTSESLVDVHDMKNEGSYVKVFSEVVDAGLVEVLEADKVDEIDLQSEENVTEVIFQVSGAGNAGDIVGEELVHVEENTTPEVVIHSEEIETENNDALTEVLEPHCEASGAAYEEMDVLADANNHNEVKLDETVAFEDSTGDGLEVAEDWGVEHITNSVGDGMLNNLEKVEEITEVVSRYSKETVKTAIAGVVSSLLLAVIGFLGLQKLKRANKTLQEEAASEPEQDAIRRQHHVKQVDHFAYSFNSGVGAPRVRLLGEYTVGEKEVSSYSLRTDYVENYNDSSCSFSQRNLKMSTSQPAVSGFSSTTGTPPYGGETSQRRSHKKEVPASSIDSPSYGSFTTEMMFRMKEEARGGEKIIVTPVRRSSRIHSKRTPGASE